MHGYVCRRLRDLPDSLAERLANDPAARDAFWEEERRRCSDPEDGFLFWLDNYAAHIDARGQMEVLDLWDWQRELAAKLVDTQNLISVKARRVGMTVIVLHYCLWVAAFQPDAEMGTIAIFSLNHKAAKSALKLLRRFLEAQPAMLLPRTEWGADAGCVDTSEEIGFLRGSTIVSYAANSGARGQTLRLAFWDEAARAEGPIDAAQSLAEAMIPAVEGGGQLIVASTGQGRSGRGQVFARLWDRAASGELDWDTWFVSRYDRPGRDEAWWQRVKLELGEARAEQEYPENPDQALAGDQEGAHLPASHIAAAVALGREWEAKGLPAPHGDRIWLGLDWGMNTAGVVVYPLANGDLYIADELVEFGVDSETVTKRLVALAQPHLKNRTQLSHLYYDSAGAQQAVTMQAVLRGISPRTRPEGVRFGKTRKATVEFIRGALERTAAGADFARIGISPRCESLINQMRDGRMAADGDRQKGDDHTFDAMIAALADHAFQYQRAVNRVA